MPPDKRDPVAKPKPADPSLGEILSGVDIIGTMLHLDLPRLEQQLAEIKSLLAPAAAAERSARSDSGEMETALEELKEMIQLQGEQLLSLERRLLHLTTICEAWEAGPDES